MCPSFRTTPTTWPALYASGLLPSASSASSSHTSTISKWVSRHRTQTVCQFITVRASLFICNFIPYSSLPCECTRSTRSSPDRSPTTGSRTLYEYQYLKAAFIFVHLHFTLEGFYKILCFISPEWICRYFFFFLHCYL